MQKAKSGLDGLPPEVFLELWDVIGPLLLDSINFALNTGSSHREQNTSLISVLLKKGKPPLRCGSYRPISLITTELKLFAKVLVRRLERFMGKLIHHDQTGFLNGRLALDNIRRLFHIMHASESVEDPAEYSVWMHKKPLIGWVGNTYGQSWRNLDLGANLC